MPYRVNAAQLSPGAYQAMYALEQYVRASSIEHPLIELVKLRASYINGCAHCVDMHTKDARDAGETEQRLYAVAVWRETPFFSPRERAALAWTEKVTRLGQDGVSDEDYEQARAQFSETEMVELTMAIVTINGWNRVAISLGADVGSYQPKAGSAT